MSHEIEYRNGKHSIAWCNQVPWHGLGKQVPDDLTPEQMLEAAGLDWSVDKKPLYVKIENKDIPCDDYALVRSDDNKILDVISKDWEPLQNAEAFGFFHEFIMAGNMKMDTAGSLKGGKIVWGLAKIDHSFELFGGDQVENYLLFTNPHQYGKSIDIRITTIRTVCWNTLTLATQNNVDKMVRINHRRKFNADEVKETLGLAHEKFDTYKEMAQFLGSKRAKPEMVDEYLSSLFPSSKEGKLSRPAQTILDIIPQQPGAEYAEGSWWSVFNGVTFATDHILGNSADTRLSSSWYGINRARKLKALEDAVEYAEASGSL